MFPEYIPLSQLLIQGIQSNKKMHLIKQLLEAINHIHNKNIVHKDIKPGNIGVEMPSWTLKVFDFDCSEVDGILNNATGSLGKFVQILNNRMCSRN